MSETLTDHGNKEAKLHDELADAYHHISFWHKEAGEALRQGNILRWRACTASVKAYQLSAMAWESALRDL